MKNRLPLIVIVLLILTNVFTFVYYPSVKRAPAEEKFEEYIEAVRNYQGDLLSLPEPLKGGFVSVEEAIFSRRSRRKYSEDPLTLVQISQLLWAAQGITSEEGKRAVPSAGGIYPLNIYVVVRNVRDLENGVYHYLNNGHKLGKLLGESALEAFYKTTNQSYSKDSAITFVITANYPKVAQRYKGEAAKEFSLQESGHVGQNLYLQGESLGLAMVVTTGFDQQSIKEVLRLPDQETVVYLIPVGNKMLE